MPAERTIGNYVLGAILGRGGMSEVHAAEHRFLGDRVAIKLLRAHLAGDPDATTAFTAEATRTRAIDHPNVVRVLDFGIDGEDCYLVMERLDGEDLGARLARVARLDEAEVRWLGAAIADGASAAHDRGIVHRDLKPSNIMLGPDPRDPPKIVDFGIARTVGRNAATVTGSRVGTLAYMAPEQLSGGLIAPCVDVWALGVILYEALAGRLPFDNFTEGRSPQLFETPPPLGGLAAVSPALEALVRACLERDPARRPPSMQAIAHALREPATDQRFTEDLPPLAGRDASVATRDPSVGGLASPPRPRRRMGVPLIALTAVLAFGAAWMLATHGRGDPETSRPARASLPSPSPPDAVAAPPDGSDSTVADAAVPSSDVASTAASTTFTVEVRSAPAGASVIVGGKRVGVTPTTIALEVPASILVTRAGYRPQRVRAERAGPLDVRLVPARRSRPSHSPHPAGETLD